MGLDTLGNQARDNYGFFFLSYDIGIRFKFMRFAHFTILCVSILFGSR